MPHGSAASPFAKTSIPLDRDRAKWIAEALAGRTPEQYLADEFAKDICLECGHGESRHELGFDRWGSPVVRCCDGRGYYL